MKELVSNPLLGTSSLCDKAISLPVAPFPVYAVRIQHTAEQKSTSAGEVCHGKGDGGIAEQGWNRSEWQRTTWNAHPNRSSNLVLWCLHGSGSAPCTHGRARPGARGSESGHFNSFCQRSIRLMQRGNSWAAAFREKHHNLLRGLGHHWSIWQSQ